MPGNYRVNFFNNLCFGSLKAHKCKIYYIGVNTMCYKTLVLKAFYIGVTGCLLRGKKVTLRNVTVRHSIAMLRNGRLKVHSCKIFFDGVNKLCCKTLMLRNIHVVGSGYLLTGKMISLRNTMIRTEGLRCIIVKYILMG